MPPTTPPTIAPMGVEEDDEEVASPEGEAVPLSGGAGAAGVTGPSTLGGCEAASGAGGPSTPGGCEAASGTLGFCTMPLGGVGITAKGGSKYIIIGGWGPSLGGDGGRGRAGQVGELMKFSM